jgi:hypothetical protein
MSAQDLFVWRDEADAFERLRQALQVRAEAERARRYAPRGQILIRQARLEEATADALRAELELVEVQRRGVQS